MLVSALLFIVGMVLLIKGADFLVGGASSLAKRLRISDIAIGLTIVAFGTSAPEFIVNVFSATRGTTDIAIGNIVGSNIANLLLILGIAACIYPLAVKKNTTWKEIPLLLLAVIMLAVMVNDSAIDGSGSAALTRSDGIALLGFFLIFLYYVFGIARVEGEGEPIHTLSISRSVLFVTVGLAALTIGGKMTVDSAMALARMLGLSDAFIGLTIVAIGTSLPELATSVVAAMKKEVDIAVGNVVGSNIFNIFWVLGATAILRPLPFSPAMNSDILVMIAASFFLFIAMFVGKRRILERWQGALFIVGYIGYITFLVQRG